MAFTYTTLTTTTFEVTDGLKYKAIFNGDTAVADATILQMNNQELDANKKVKLKELLEYVSSQEIAMKEAYSTISIGSFTDKRYEAIAWKIDNTVATPYSDMLCTDINGVLDTTARDTLLNAILAKVQSIAQLEAYEDATRTAIKSCTTQADLDLITTQG